MNTIDRYLDENSNDIGLMKKILIQNCKKYERIHSKLQKKVRNLDELKNYFLSSVQPVITTNRNMYFNFLMLVLNKIEDFELTPDEKLLFHKFAKYVAFTTFISLPDKKHIEQIHTQTGFDCVSFFDELGICYRYKLMGVPIFKDISLDFNKVNYFDYINGKIFNEIEKLIKIKYPDEGNFNLLDEKIQKDKNIRIKYNYVVGIFSNILQINVSKKFNSGSLTKSLYNQSINEIKKYEKSLNVNAILELLFLEIAEESAIIDEMDIQIIQLIPPIVKFKTNALKIKYNNIHFANDYFVISKFIKPTKSDTKHELVKKSYTTADSSFKILGTKKELEKANSKSDIFKVLTNFINKIDDFDKFEDAIDEIRNYKQPNGINNEDN